jgi:hypothetical protein
MPYRKHSPGITYIQVIRIHELYPGDENNQDLSDIENNKVYLDSLFEFRVVLIKRESLLIRLESYGYPGDLPVV